MLTDRVCVITGAGNGIGAEHAKLFRSLGAKVVVNDVEPGEGVDNTDDVSDFAGAGRLIAAGDRGARPPRRPRQQRRASCATPSSTA